MVIFVSKSTIFDIKIIFHGSLWPFSAIREHRTASNVNFSTKKSILFQYTRYVFLEIVPIFEVLFMELIWHISGELIMYKILRGRWIWSVCFAPPFVLLSNAERFRVRLLRNTRANNFSIPFLLSSAGRTVVEGEHLPNEHQNSTSTVGTHKRTSTWISRTAYIDLKVGNQNSIYNTSKHVII